MLIATVLAAIPSAGAGWTEDVFEDENGIPCRVGAQADWEAAGASWRADGDHKAHTDASQTVPCGAYGELEESSDGTIDDCEIPTPFAANWCDTGDSDDVYGCAQIRAGTHLFVTGEGVWTGWLQSPAC